MANAKQLPPAVFKHIERIPERLAWLKGERNVKMWAQQLSMPQQVLQPYMHGSTPRLEFFVHLARRERVNLNWLLFGDGKPYREE